jgi:hypothetical protein
VVAVLTGFLKLPAMCPEVLLTEPFAITAKLFVVITPEVSVKAPLIVKLVAATKPAALLTVTLVNDPVLVIV